MKMVFKKWKEKGLKWKDKGKIEVKIRKKGKNLQKMWVKN
jgi:hypothetical protein